MNTIIQTPDTGGAEVPTDEEKSIKSITSPMGLSNEAGRGSASLLNQNKLEIKRSKAGVWDSIVDDDPETDPLHNSALGTFVWSMREYNTFGAADSWLTYREGFSEDEDTDFTAKMSPSNANAIARQYNLPSDSATRILEAKNSKHLDRILTGEFESNNNRKIINESAGSYTQALFMGTAMVADPTYAISFSTVPKTLKALAALNSASRVSRTTGALTASLTIESTLAIARGEVNKYYTTDDVLLDSLIGGMFGMFGGTSRGIKEAAVDTKLLPYRRMIEHNEFRRNTLELPPLRQPWDSSMDFKWSTDKPVKQSTAADDILETTTKTESSGEQIIKTIPIEEAVETIAKVTTKLSGDDIATASKTITEDTDEIIKAIRGLENLETPAAKQLIKDIEGDILNTIKQVSQSDADRIIFALEKRLGTQKKPAKYTEEDVAGFNNRKKAEESSQKKTKSNLSTIKSFGRKKIEELTKKADEAKKKLKPLKKGQDDVPILQKKLDAKRAEVRKQQDKLPNITTKGARTNAIKKLRRLNSEAKVLSKEVDELSSTRKVNEDVILKNSKDSLARQESMYKMVANEVEELLYDISVSMKEVIKNADMTKKQLADYSKELSREIGRVLGHDIKVTIKADGSMSVNKPIQMKVNPDGTVTIGKKKIAVATVLLMGGGTYAQAGDASIVSMAMLPGIIVLGILLGSGGTRAVMEKGFGKAITDGYRGVASSFKRAERMTDPNSSWLRNTIDQGAEGARTAFLESIVKVLKDGSDWSKDMIKKLGYDSVNGGYRDAETAKKMLVNGLVNRFRRTYEIPAFEAWKKAGLDDGSLNYSWLDKVDAATGETNLQSMFRQKVSDCIENPSKCSDVNIGSAANGWKKEVEDLFMKANKAGVDGFDDAALAAYKDNYFPHLWNSTLLGDAIRMADDIAPLRQGFINMIVAGKRAKPIPLSAATRMADTMIDMFKHKGGFGGSKSAVQIQTILDTLDNLGYNIKGVSVDDVLKEGFDYSEILNRAKKRIELDPQAFGTVMLKKDGVEFEVKLEHIMERDSYTALERYARDVVAHTVVKETTGFGSEMSLRRAVTDNELDPQVLEVFDYHINLLYNKPIFKLGSEKNRNLNIARNSSFMMVLGWVMTSMTPEFLKTIGSLATSSASRTELFSMLGSVGRSIDSRTQLFTELQNVGGWGSAGARQDYKWRGVDDLLGEAENPLGLRGFGNQLHTLSAKGKAGITRFSGMLWATDVMERLQSVAQAEKLASMAHGKSSMSRGRMRRYGISDDFLTRMQGRLKLNKNGDLLDMDFDNWSKADQSEFQTVLNRMMMNKVQQTTAGGTGMWMQSSSVGRAVGYILTFASQAYSNHFIGGMKSLDMEEAMAQIMWLGGAYMGYSARYAMQGKEVSDEDILMYTIASMPFATPFSVANGVIDPVIFGAAQNMKDTVIGLGAAVE